jgi:citrate lyase subunit beta/citryl-CoA lyase
MLKRHVPSGIRSFLYAPANRARELAEAFDSIADAVVLDLEHSVAVAEQDAARRHAVEALRRPRGMKGYVRINAFPTRYCIADLDAVVGRWLDGVVLPKAEAPEALQVVAQRMSRLEEGAGIPAGTLDLIALIDSAKGLQRCDELAAATPRVRHLALGGEAYMQDLELEWSAGEQELSYARARLTHASRVAGIEPPIDTAVLQIPDHERFRSSALNGRRMGFQGKLCTAVNQLAACHEVFTPSAPEVERARAVVSAFELAQARGKAPLRPEVEALDQPRVHQARRILALAARGRLDP